MLLAGEQAHEIFAVREPGEEIEEEQQDKHQDDPYVSDECLVTEKEDEPLQYGEPAHAKERPHRAPLRKRDIEYDADERKKREEDIPGAVAREAEPQ